MKLSIVTPSYNQAKYLEETIKSVLAQNIPGMEYIIVDGGSTDGSIEVIKKYADKLTWWVSEKDRGQTDALNKGFAKATGDVLAWLNSDDLLYPGAAQKALDFLQTHPDVGLVYGDADYIDGESRVIGSFPAAQTDLKRLQQGYVHVPQQATFFRGDLWRKVGPLDPNFYFAMDYDLWVRLAKVSQLTYLPGQKWAAFRLHADAKTINADDRCWPEMLKVHFRDGGSRFSVIVLKYYFRKLAAPYITWKRRRMFKRK
jgi:glycosyltransferase involved in cell wall biosynthesis